MRRAYVEGHVPFVDGFHLALRWAGEDAAIRVGDTATVESNKWLEQLGIPITSASSRSRFHGVARGTVIGTFLNLSEVLELERGDNVNGIVVVPAHGRHKLLPTMSGHAPWITAFDVECLGGDAIAPLADASPPIKAAVKGLTGLAVSNQGLVDNRERSAVVQVLSYFRSRGVEIDPDALMVEALRNQWGDRGAEDLREIAIEVNKGKKLRFDKRVSPQALREWADAQ
ncbi:hypothetical protein QWI29_15105 [Mycolicibacterium neoaurum]|uniref:hypothetical protein n=1 Tax=Mycolicibacterium neoaurum TaxID=1795 RepID=UPI002672D31F|nr:hypothetical protein [Mycolicibacterium neoaurum]MDO3401365.1 hypothetical protein [Mycolicibacterium neoaurum]